MQTVLNAADSKNQNPQMFLSDVVAVFKMSESIWLFNKKTMWPIWNQTANAKTHSIEAQTDIREDGERILDAFMTAE